MVKKFGNIHDLALLSTVYIPILRESRVVVEEVDARDTELVMSLLRRVTRNHHGHGSTIHLLRGLVPSIPETQRGNRRTWDGAGFALVARPNAEARRNEARHGRDVVVRDIRDLELAVIHWEVGPNGNR